MAGRKAGFLHNDETRAKIKAGVIIERLMRHIEADAPIMDASQVNAAKALLSKVLPDLSTTTLEGNPDKPLHNIIRREIVDSNSSSST